MKKFKLLMLTLMLVGGISMYNAPSSANSCSGGDGCPQGPGGPNGCRCCSDNQCDSGYCGKDDKCAKKPGSEGGSEPVAPISPIMD